MKKLFVGLMTLCLAAPGFAQFMETDTKVLKLDVFVDEDAFDDEYIGLEVGFGVALYDLDKVGLFGGGAETKDDLNFQFVGLEIEEHYPIGMGLIPFAGLAAGYSHAELKGIKERDGFFGRAHGGVKIPITRNIVMAGMIRFWLAPEDVILDDGDLNDNRWDVAAGVRWLY